MVEYVVMAILAVMSVSLLVTKANVAISFLALCAGSIVVSSSGENAGLIASSLTSGMDSAASYAKLVILFLPLSIVIFVTRGQAKSYLFLLNLVVAVCTVMASLIFAYPFLPELAVAAIDQVEVWSALSQYEEFIVGVGVLSSLTTIALSSRRPKDKKRK